MSLRKDRWHVGAYSPPFAVKRVFPEVRVIARIHVRLSEPFHQTCLYSLMKLCLLYVLFYMIGIYLKGLAKGIRWNAGAHQLVRDLVRVRAQRAPPAVRSAASSAWARRWWTMLAVSVQHAVTSTALGSAWPAPLHASQQSAPELERVLDLADAAGPSRLPLRGL